MKFIAIIAALSTASAVDGCNAVVTLSATPTADCTCDASCTVCLGAAAGAMGADQCISGCTGGLVVPTTAAVFGTCAAAAATTAATTTAATTTAATGTKVELTDEARNLL